MRLWQLRWQHAPVVEDLIGLEMDGSLHIAYLKQEILAVAPVLCKLGDNPCASELLNHQESTTRKFCRMCLLVNAVLSVCVSVYTL